MENSQKRNVFQKFNEKYPKLSEIIRFVIVGGIATVIDMLVMGVVLYLFNPSLYPKFYNVWIGKLAEPSTIATVVGTGLGFIVSLVVNYLLSVLFVYTEKGNSKTTKGKILFTVLSVIGLLINMGGMWLGRDAFKINEWIVKIVMTLVVLVYNYITRKIFIFKKQPEEIEEKEKTR
ncbi:MAG: GtrA family protein [Clostridia bacterium]|nr:GtrA family protein [Clostridia bacterium]